MKALDDHPVALPLTLLLHTVLVSALLLAAMAL